MASLLGIGRERLGYPEWRKVSQWLNKEITAPYPAREEPKLLGIKNPEIPVLKKYDGIASDTFWEKFPKKDLPLKAETKVNVTSLKKKILSAKSKMSRTEFNRAKRLLRNLQNGAESFQRSPLPPISTRNATSTST